VSLRGTRAGMNVAQLPGVSRVGLEEGDFEHAVDNSGDSIGLVADRRALARRWRPDSPAARSRRGGVDH